MRGLFLAGVFHCCFAEGGRNLQFLRPENPVLWAEHSLTPSPRTQGKSFLKDGWNLSPSKADSSFTIHFSSGNLYLGFGSVQSVHTHEIQECSVLAAADDYTGWCSRISSKQAHDCSLSSKGFMLFYLQEDEIMPVRFDENSLIWVAADEPIKHNSFLSPKILELCRDLPIFWLRPTYPKGNTSSIWKMCYPSLHLNAFPKLGLPPRLAHMGNQDPFLPFPACFLKPSWVRAEIACLEFIHTY